MNELWERALSTLRDKLSTENFETWLSPVDCDAIEGDTAVLRIPNRFYADWISNHYSALLLEAFEEAAPTSGAPTRLRFEVDEQLQDKGAPRAPFGSRASPTPRFWFSASCAAVAHDPQSRPT